MTGTWVPTVVPSVFYRASAFLYGVDPANVLNGKEPGLKIYGLDIGQCLVTSDSLALKLYGAELMKVLKAKN
jgi:hypothetical protein